MIDLCHRKQLGGLVHVGIGQEGVAVGIATALGEGDYLYGTHRSHGHFLARGADPNLLLAELAGKDTGFCRGRGGSWPRITRGHGSRRAASLRSSP